MLTKSLLSVALLGAMVVTTGCQTEQNNVPADAQIVTAGNKLVQYVPSTAGEVFIYNVDDQALVYSGKVDRDDVVVVDPDQNRITIDNQIASEKDLDRGDQYRIYFRPSGEIRREVRVEETRIERQHSN